MSTEAALLAAIAADPDDDTARLVYADFLEEKGGESDAARAQFIRAQIELIKPPQKGDAKRRRELLSTAKKLHKQYGAAWAAPVFDALGTKEGKYSREISYDEWDRGFRNWAMFDDLAAFRARADAVTALTPLVGVGLWRFNDGEARELIADPRLRTVKNLSLCGHSRTGPDVGDETAAVMAACPNLARLERLALIQNALTTAGVRALAHSAVLTRLTALELYGNSALSDDTYAMLVSSPLGARMTEWGVSGSGLVTSEAARILARATHLTQIRALSFSNTGLTDAGVEALAKAEHLSSARDLDFRNTNLSHRAAMAIAKSPVFANLEQLNFVKTWIGGFGAKALRDSKYLKKISFLALYDAVPGASEAALKKRFGRKVEFGRV